MLTLTLPLYAKSLNVSYSLVSIAVGAVGLGTLVMDLPAGILIGRIGRKPVMIIGVVSLAITSFALGMAESFSQIILYRFIAGLGSAMWSISRHTYITDVVPVTMRGRALASFGGINRIGSFAALRLAVISAIIMA